MRVRVRVRVRVKVRATWNVCGTKVKSPGSARIMRLRFLASRFFLASSDMPGKWFTWLGLGLGLGLE